jgi:hypothetical protein
MKSAQKLRQEQRCKAAGFQKQELAVAHVKLHPGLYIGSAAIRVSQFMTDK